MKLLDLSLQQPSFVNLTCIKHNTFELQLKDNNLFFRLWWVIIESKDQYVRCIGKSTTTNYDQLAVKENFSHKTKKSFV